MATYRLLSIGMLALSLLLLQRAWPAPPAAAAEVAITIRDFQFNPSAITVAVGDTVVWTNLDGANHNVTSDTGLFSSPLMIRGASFRFTPTEPGTYNYHCEIHPFIQGTVVAQPPAAPAIPAAPGLTSPADAQRLSSFGPDLAWTNPEGTTQYHLQVIPFNNDGPGVDLQVGSADTSFAIPPPPAWFGLLPDMTYTWRVRVANVPVFLAMDDPRWSPWSERRFRTPFVSPDVISAFSPTPGSSITTVNPTIQWNSARNDIFYYEFQMSRDSSFGPNTFLYSELKHGALTTPPNSYRVPNQFPLTSGAVYFWRVRPRVQGDGTPVAWPGPWSFRVQ